MYETKWLGGSGLTRARVLPALTSYSVPKNGQCSIPVTAILTNPARKLYIVSAETASGAIRNAWVCDSHDHVDVVIEVSPTFPFKHFLNDAALVLPKFEESLEGQS